MNKTTNRLQELNDLKIFCSEFEKSLNNVFKGLNWNRNTFESILMEASEPSTSKATTSGLNSNERIDPTTVAEAKAAGLSVEEFLSSGRTGRRNALPDILEEKSSHLNTSELPNQLQKLSFSDSIQPKGGSDEPTATTSGN